MEFMEAADLEAVADGLGVYPGSEELCTRDDAVLRGG
jgi:hypothetical protein